MATADHDSSLEMEVGPVPLGGGPNARKAPEVEIWLDGGVLACACPECGAPMSIRLWLLLADCWRCGTSIELTEEQERLALRLLREQEEALASGPAIAAAEPTAKESPPPAASLAQAVRPAARQPPPSGPSPGDQSAGPAKSDKAPAPAARPRRITAAEAAARARLRRAREGRPLGTLLGNLLEDMPAWLVSLVVHMVALLLLSITFGRAVDDDRRVTLSTSVGPENLESELGLSPEPLVTHEFEDGGLLAWQPVSSSAVLGDPQLDLAPKDPGLSAPVMPLLRSEPLTLVSTPPAAPGRLLQGRDPEVRAQVAYSSGGTSATEAAVARALRWLARHQNKDGSFSLHAFNRTSDCNGQCDGAARQASDHAGTALALLPYLGAGQTHLTGQYTKEVFAALRWLIDHQRDDGDLRGPGGFGRMYAHGQAAIVLCEAYALTGDEQLRGPAQLALDFIVKAQHGAGGWRYEPGEPGDTSVVGWQLMALNSGRMAHLQVPPETLQRAGAFLDSVATDRVGGTYSYLPGHGASPVMTAEALLCRQYLGWARDHEGMKVGVRLLVDQNPPDAGRQGVYYWYYATQVLHHLGGKDWDAWNEQMRRVLLETQVKKGHAAGSWDPRGDHAPAAGRLYQTALAACTLEVYYRYMPLYSPDAVPRQVVQEPMRADAELPDTER